MEIANSGPGRTTDAYTAWACTQMGWVNLSSKYLGCATSLLLRAIGFIKFIFIGSAC